MAVTSCGTDLADYKPVTVAAGAAVYIAVHPQKVYSIQHTSLNAAGGADTTTVYVGHNTDVTADESAEVGKVILKSGGACVIGPHCTVLYLKSSGAPMLNVACDPFSPDS